MPAFRAGRSATFHCSGCDRSWWRRCGGATAHALLGIVEAGNFPASQCGPVNAAGLRVYPPNQTQSRVAPYPFSACSKSGPIYLRIGPMQSGT